MKQVVILGGGFGGVATMQALKSDCNQDQVHITLIDKDAFHTFTPSLYEVATNEAPQRTIAIPFEHLIGKNCEIVVGTVASIASEQQVVYLTNNSTFSYDILVIALGSETAYFHIPGLQENSLPLKTLADAVAIKQALLDRTKTLQTEHPFKIVVGGGGFSGVEFAAELAELQKTICRKQGASMTAISITVIEGLPRLLNGLDPVVSEQAKNRLQKNGINLVLGNNIQAVTENGIVTADGTNHPYDLFIWTGGVVANSVVKNSGLALNKKGQIIVDPTLAVSDKPNIFAVGDIAGFLDPTTQKPAPWLAQTAEDQGKIVAENILAIIENRPKRSYKLQDYWYVVPLKGHYALAVIGKFRFSGIFGWILEQAAYLKYLIQVLPLPKALYKWNQFEVELEQ